MDERRRAAARALPETGTGEWKGVELQQEFASQFPMARVILLQCGVPEVRIPKSREAAADSSLTTPKLKGVWGPVRSE